MKFRFGYLLLPLLLMVNLQSLIGQTASTRVRSRDRAATTEASADMSSNEASMMLLIRYIHAAEATFQATTGAGRFGTLQELYLAKLIDVRVRTGVNDGYSFVLTVSNLVGAPSSFEVIAKPVVYMETGVRTFAINESGWLRVSYVQNPLPAQLKLVTNECMTVYCTEAYARSALRNIHSAEATYQSTAGSGKYGTLQQLAQSGLISAALASGNLNGYSFDVRVDDGSMTEPPTFEGRATPLRFPRTGIVSFYIDENGILRGGYKNGFEADAGDDPICG